MLKTFSVPLDVPFTKKRLFLKRYKKFTLNANKVILFAGDQRVEHLITSFYGKDIYYGDLYPKHYFDIASQSPISALAVQYGLLTLYGGDYPQVPYVVKMNSISKLTKKGYGYGFSKKWLSIQEVHNFQKKSKLNIVGIGYTVYLGIKEESKMLSEASKLIRQAHFLGYPFILWIYPKGKGVKDERSFVNIATACSIGNALGADFIKINAPKEPLPNSVENLSNAVKAAGKTKVLVAGGSAITFDDLIKRSYKQVFTGGATGVALGRNIHQRSVTEASKLIHSLYKVLVDGENIILTDKNKKSQTSSII